MQPPIEYNLPFSKTYILLADDSIARSICVAGTCCIWEKYFYRYSYAHKKAVELNHYLLCTVPEGKENTNQRPYSPLPSLKESQLSSSQPLSPPFRLTTTQTTPQ